MHENVSPVFIVIALKIFSLQAAPTVRIIVFHSYYKQSASNEAKTEFTPRSGRLFVEKP
jgi:hypothetical protein